MCDKSCASFCSRSCRWVLCLHLHLQFVHFYEFRWGGCGRYLSFWKIWSVGLNCLMIAHVVRKAHSLQFSMFCSQAMQSSHSGVKPIWPWLTGQPTVRAYYGCENKRVCMNKHTTVITLPTWDRNLTHIQTCAVSMQVRQKSATLNAASHKSWMNWLDLLFGVWFSLYEGIFFFEIINYFFMGEMTLLQPELSM